MKKNAISKNITGNIFLFRIVPNKSKSFKQTPTYRAINFFFFFFFWRGYRAINLKVETSPSTFKKNKIK